LQYWDQEMYGTSGQGLGVLLCYLGECVTNAKSDTYLLACTVSI